MVKPRNISVKNLKLPLLLFLVVCIEAFTILVVFDQASSEVLLGDAPAYQQTAIKIINGGTFSLAENSLLPSETAVSNIRNSMNEPTMVKTPGYPLFIAIIYLFSDYSILALRLAQYLLLWLSAWGVYCLAKYFVNEQTSVISSLLTATYVPLVFFPIYHATELLATVLIIWSFATALKWKAHSKKLDVIICSTLFGYLILVRPNWALLCIPILLILYFKDKNEGRTSGILIFVAICFLMISPWLLRNYFLTGQVTMSSATNQSLYASVLQYEGKISPAFTSENWKMFIDDIQKRSKSIEDHNEIAGVDNPLIRKELLLANSYKGSIVDGLRNLNLFRAAGSIPKRIVYLWSTADIAPIEIYRMFSHRLAQIQYLLMIIFGFIGLVLKRNQFKMFWVLLTPAVYITLIHLVFHVEARYSIPARPLLLIFASVGVVWLIGKLKSRFGS